MGGGLRPVTATACSCLCGLGGSLKRSRVAAGAWGLREEGSRDRLLEPGIPLWESLELCRCLSPLHSGAPPTLDCEVLSRTHSGPSPH